MVRVKICGITRLEDALAAVHAGADAVGFIFAKSPRYIHPEKASSIIKQLPPFVTTVGVFVNTNEHDILTIKNQCGLDMIQLHGEECIITDYSDCQKKNNICISLKTIKRLIKTIKISKVISGEPDNYPNISLLLDTFIPNSEIQGGSGKVFDWRLAIPIAKKRPIILAGGLHPENVAQAIQLVQPYGVDVSSGVESEPGIKDHQKIIAFIQQAKFLS